MKPRTPTLRPRVSLWLETPEGQPVFGKGRMAMLDAIDAQGSLSAAAQALGMSYRGMWARLRRSEERLGVSLVSSHAGRGKSSGSTLTPEGRELAQRYRLLLQRITAAADQAYAEIFGPPAG